jgi:hypothetical protein
MRKIATPRILQAELQRLQAYAGGVNPSRNVLAAELRKLAEAVEDKGAAGKDAFKWGSFATACEAAGRELHTLAKEADEARHADGEHKEDIQKIFEAVKKGQLEVDHAVILANTLASKLRKAR